MGIAERDMTDGLGAASAAELKADRAKNRKWGVFQSLKPMPYDQVCDVFLPCACLKDSDFVFHTSVLSWEVFTARSRPIVRTLTRRPTQACIFALHAFGLLYAWSRIRYVQTQLGRLCWSAPA